MFVLLDDSGKFLGARLLTQAENSAQVELDSGRRIKVKLANVVLQFAQPDPAILLEQARALAPTVDLDLAWQCAPDDEFGFADLAADYFGASPDLVQQVASLLALFDAPHYFRRAGKGRFRKAGAEVVQQALAAIARRQAQERQIAQWAQELAQGECPAPVAEQLYRILFKPDKNAPEYKAVVQAARTTQLGALALLQRAGAINSPYQFHWKRFLLETFPQGTGFGALDQRALPPDPELPVADVQAFSIDDSATTEIDDALSVQGLGSPEVVVGIHIAAPGLGLQVGDAFDAVARQRLSTVYMPGHKITMLPDSVVQRYTLQEGRACPALSLYLTLDAVTLEPRARRTTLERVPIVANLRHDQLETIATTAWLDDPSVEAPNTPQALSDLRPALSFLQRLAKQRKALREQVRGKPETHNRPDYNFRLLRADAGGALRPSCGEPGGDEQVQISERPRGAALDLIVAEAMILANQHWGQWLAELGVPGIYRSQASLAPGIKVRMGTRPLPHAGLGVPCYAWSTSPLRRYTDLVNQWQLLACVRHRQTAALAAPFKPKDAALMAVLSGFDAAYTDYQRFQASMERYWTLRHLQQAHITEIDAEVLREPLVRACTLPLVFSVVGCAGMPRGTRVRVRLGAIDTLALDVGGTVLSRLGEASADASADDDSADDGDQAAAGPLQLAVQLDDAEVGAEATSPAA